LGRRDKTFANQPVALVEFSQSAKFLPSLKNASNAGFPMD